MLEVEVRDVVTNATGAARIGHLHTIAQPEVPNADYATGRVTTRACARVPNLQLEQSKMKLPTNNRLNNNNFSKSLPPTSKALPNQTQ